VLLLKRGLLAQALPLQMFLMVFFSDDPHVVICFSKSSSSDIRAGELASFELCLLRSWGAALLPRAELTGSLSLLSAGEVLSRAGPHWVSSSWSGTQV